MDRPFTEKDNLRSFKLIKGIERGKLEYPITDPHEDPYMKNHGILWLSEPMLYIPAGALSYQWIYWIYVSASEVEEIEE